MQLQTQFYITKLEKRTVENNGGIVIEGIACPYRSWSQTLGWNSDFKEQFMPGSFSESLGKRNICCTVDHNRDKLVATTQGGTLVITDTAEGLHIRASVPNTAVGNELVTHIDRRDIQGMSFDFRANSDKWERIDDIACRTITKAELYEVCFCPDPAYLATSAEISQRTRREVPKVPPRIPLSQVANFLKLHGATV